MYFHLGWVGRTLLQVRECLQGQAQYLNPHLHQPHRRRLYPHLRLRLHPRLHPHLKGKANFCLHLHLHLSFLALLCTMRREGYRMHLHPLSFLAPLHMMRKADCHLNLHLCPILVR